MYRAWDPLAEFSPSSSYIDSYSASTYLPECPHLALCSKFQVCCTPAELPPKEQLDDDCGSSNLEVEAVDVIQL